MRVGVVYAPRTKWPKWDWVADALSNLGHDVVRVTHSDQLMAADAECEVLLFEHRDCGIGWRHVRDKADKRTAVWAQWWFDLVATQANQPLADQPQFRLCGPAMRLFDHVFVKERDLLDEYKSLGVNAAYMDQGCPSRWPACEHKASPQWDVLVFGSADSIYRDRRHAVQQLLSDGFSVVWATDHGPVQNGVQQLPWCHPNQLSALMSDARCVLCVDLRSDVPGYVSDRNWLVSGAGAIPLVRQPGRDIRDLAKALCDAPLEKRQRLGEYLRTRTLGRNTYEKRLQGILAVIDGVGGGANGEASMQVLQGDETGLSHSPREIQESAMRGV